MLKSRFTLSNYIYGLLLPGVFIVLLFQLLHNRSLWIDEAMLSLNIISRSPGQLLQPLDDFQVAPILFLFIEKMLTTLFGNSETVLRLFPFICSLIALPVYYFLCCRTTRNKSLSLGALVLLGLSPEFVYYSSEVKQYAVDVLVAMIIYAVALLPNPFISRNRGWLLIITGVVAIFLSNVSVVILCTVGLLFAYRTWRSKQLRKQEWIAAAFWIVFFSLNYFLFIYHHPSTGYMKDYWKNSFMPLNPFSEAFRLFAGKSIYQIFRDMLPGFSLGYSFVIGFLLYLAGIIFMLRQRKTTLVYLCVAPVVIHLLLSSLRLYPFELRLVLYQAPLHILVMTYGIWNLVRPISANLFIQKAFFIFGVAIFSFRLFLDFPVEHDEIKPAISHINRLSTPGESVYVFWGSIPATKYYIATGLARFERLRIIWGEPRSGSSATYLQDLRGVRGHTWLLISHLYPYNGTREEEKQVVLALQNRGSLLDRFEEQGSTVYRFDLK